MRIKAAYRTQGVRWVHTEPLHPMTGYFTRLFTERIALLRANWSHYPIILRMEKEGFIDHAQYNCYLNFHTPKTNFRAFVEHNLLTNYLPLTQHGVVVETYKQQSLDTQTQSEPDIVFNFKNSSFQDKRVHGLDQKSGTTQLGSSLIYSNMGKTIYQKKLKTFQAQLGYHTPEDTIDATQIARALSLLGHSCDLLIQHQIIWAKHVHLFPKGFIPPMRVPHNFSLEDAHPKFLDAITKAELKMTKISNYLYFKPINPHNNGLPEEALDLFKDSHMQELMR